MLQLDVKREGGKGCGNMCRSSIINYLFPGVLVCMSMICT